MDNSKPLHGNGRRDLRLGKHDNARNKEFQKAALEKKYSVLQSLRLNAIQ
ncbi:MAG: hypothetical protein WA857_12230 [Candidatus Acidiferrum sp.]